MTRYHLTEIQELASRMEELAQALTPAPGEVDTMVVPVSVMRRLLQFCESNLSRLRKVAEFLPDEALNEVLGVARGGDGSDVAPRCHASDVRDEEWFYP